MSDGFQMREHHQSLLERSKSYLIHNVCPTDGFWNSLLSLDILDSDMLQDLIAQSSRSEKVSALVDILPHRGPDAFDGFLVALLKCGHGFVADYLKILEVAEQFKKDIHNFNISEPVQERLVKTFKRSIPNIQRFFETKLEVNLQEQEMEFQEKEKEIDDLQDQVKCLEEEILEVKAWFKNAVQRCTYLGTELQRVYISRSTLREEGKYLEELYAKAVATEKHEKLISDFHDGMHAILDYVAMAEDRASQLEHTINCGEEKDEFGQNDIGSSGKTITAKVQSVMDLIANVMEKAVIVVKPEEENDVRNELEKSIGRLKDIIKDLRHVKQIFLLTLRKKEDLSQETLSLVNNFREIRRLEKEMNEQEKHVTDLRKRGQTFKMKSKKHKRQQEHIQESIEQKEQTLIALHDSLKKQVSSADQRVHFILSLLPDCAEGEEGVNDTKTVDSTWIPFSRGGTSLTIYPDRSDSRYSLRSDVNDDIMRSTTRSATPEKTKNHHQCSSVQSTGSAATTKKTDGAARKEGTGMMSGREKSATSIQGSNQSPRCKTNAEKFSRDTIGAAQNRLIPKSTALSGQPSKENVKTATITKSDQGKQPLTSSAKEAKPRTPNPPEKPPEKSPVKQTEGSETPTRKESPLAQQKDSARYRASTPDDKKDEKQEKVNLANNIIEVKPAPEEHKLKPECTTTMESKANIQPQKNSPTVLTKPLAQIKSTAPEQSMSTPRPSKYSAQRPNGPLSISSAKTGANPPTQNTKSSIGFDKAYSRPATNSKPIQTQHADLKVETMLREKTRRGLRTLKMNGTNTEEKDPGSPSLSARGQSSVPDRDTLSQSWMVKSAVSARPVPCDSDPLGANPGQTHPQTKKTRPKVDANRLGSNLDNVLKSGKTDCFYGRVTDAINKVKKIEPPSNSPLAPPNLTSTSTNVFTFQDACQPGHSLSTESFEGQNGQNLNSASGVSDENSSDNVHSFRTWESNGSSGMKNRALSIDGDFEDLDNGARVSSSTSRVSRSLIEEANKYPQRQVLMTKKMELK